MYIAIQATGWMQSDIAHSEKFGGRKRAESRLSEDGDRLLGRESATQRGRGGIVEADASSCYDCITSLDLVGSSAFVYTSTGICPM